MTLIAKARMLIPVAIKRPLRSFVDNRRLQRQPPLAFDATRLKPAAEIDLHAVMNDSSIADGFSADNEAISKIYQTRDILGGVNPGDRRAIYHLIGYFKPKSVLEIGTHIGASTTYIASALRRFVGPSARFTTADIVNVNGPTSAWRDARLPAPPRNLLTRLGLEQFVSFKTAPSMEALRTENSYDLIFLDGDHSAKAVYCEIAASLKVLAADGLILLHDFYPDCKPLTADNGVIEGPATAAMRIAAETSALAFIPLGDLPWPTKAGGNATSLALVAKAEQRA
jgi:predicted O-methyltransferase YrrM